MKHLFLPYELALIAKEKGLDTNALAWYNPDGRLYFYRHLQEESVGISASDVHEYNCIAPLYQQAIDWLREKHKVFIELEWANFDAELEWGYNIAAPLNKISKKGISGYFDYYEALNKAIEEAFKLITT